MILNPWVWLGALLIVLGAAGTGYLKGYRNAENAARAHHATELEKVIKESRETAVIDMQAAVEAETSRQQTRVEFKDKIVTVERMINANPDCRIGNDIVGLFNDAINGANAIASGTKHEPVSPTPPAKGREPDRNGKRVSVSY